MKGYSISLPLQSMYIQILLLFVAVNTYAEENVLQKYAWNTSTFLVYIATHPLLSV